MDFKAIEEMIKTMDNSRIGYLEVNWQGISIIMRKEGEPPFSIPVRSAENIETELNTNPKNSNLINTEFNGGKEQIDDALEDLNEEAQTKTEDINIKEIVSPIVGTFYASSSPDKPAFVKVGSKVKKGDTLCIVEAMKLMNEIQSEFNGEIIEVLVNNEQMVEYGQPMFKIKVQE